SEAREGRTVSRSVQYHRSALVNLLRSPWTEFWIATGSLDAESVALLLPYLQREGAAVRLLTDLSPAGLSDGRVDPAILDFLRQLPGCEVRSLSGLSACVYAAAGGEALITSAPLTLEGLDAPHHYGILTDDSEAVLADLNRWWSVASEISDEAWAAMVADTVRRRQAAGLRDEISTLGAFVRVSVKGTKRSRRLDPREFGVNPAEWGRAVRPVEVALYKLDDVIRAKEELEAVLAQEGLEWNGYYLVPRHFLELEWPRLFANRERELRDRLQSAEGRAILKAQLADARRDLELFLSEWYPRAETGDLDAQTWIDMQATRVLAEAVSESILEESTLEYRVLTILPEDRRSIEEMEQLLQDPKLRSVQLTFPF
ncbi:MAG: hypothetical protein ACM3XM_08410, partial [Mycobacterium leprae]